MSGAAGNAFSDLLRAALGDGVDFAWIALGAAALSMLAAAAAAWIATRMSAALERRIGIAPREEQAHDPGRSAAACAWAGAFGALALWPIAPHVYFADPDRGAFAMLALLLVAASAPALGIGPARSGPARSGPARRASSDRDPAAESARAMVAACVAALAVGAAVLAAGSGNLITISRIQARWWGLGWTVFQDPGAFLGLVAFVVTRASELPRRGAASFSAERVGAFAWSLLAATVFLGGFESPLTFWMRRSLGEDPGFLNHEVLAGGGTATHVDWGGFLFQVVAAATLALKALALDAASAWLARADRARLRPRFASPAARLALAAVAVCGAGWLSWCCSAAERIGEP